MTTRVRSSVYLVEETRIPGWLSHNRCQESNHRSLTLLRISHYQTSHGFFFFWILLGQILNSTVTEIETVLKLIVWWKMKKADWIGIEILFGLKDQNFNCEYCLTKYERTMKTHWPILAYGNSFSQLGQEIGWIVFTKQLNQRENRSQDLLQCIDWLNQQVANTFDKISVDLRKRIGKIIQLRFVALTVCHLCHLTFHRLLEIFRIFSPRFSGHQSQFFGSIGISKK